MKAAGGGSIVNFGSISWMLKQGGMPVYTTSKSAVQGLTRSLARDFGPVQHPRQHAGARLGHDREAAAPVGRRRRSRRTSPRGQCIDQPLMPSTSPAWRCSWPPTTARCAPRRTSSSTAAGPEPARHARTSAVCPTATRSTSSRSTTAAACSCRAINLGGIVTALRCPDRDGRSAQRRARPADARRTTRRATRTSAPSSAATPTASPVAASCSTAARTSWRATTGRNTLHGGPGGFGTRWWESTPLRRQGRQRRGGTALVSEDGDERLSRAGSSCTVRYTLTARQRVAHRLPRQHRPADGAQPDPSRLLQPAGGGSAIDHRLTLRGEPLPARRRDADPRAASPRSTARPSTSASRRAHRRAHPRSRMRSCSARAATTTTGCWTASDGRTALRGAPGRSRLGPRDGDRTPPSPASSSIPATSSTAACSAATARRCARATDCAWRRSTSPDSPNRRDFPSHRAAPRRRRFAAPPCTASASGARDGSTAADPGRKVPTPTLSRTGDRA